MTPVSTGLQLAVTCMRLRPLSLLAVLPGFLLRPEIAEFHVHCPLFRPFRTLVAQLQHQIPPGDTLVDYRLIKRDQRRGQVILPRDECLDRTGVIFPAVQPARLHVIAAADPDTVTDCKDC